MKSKFNYLIVALFCMSMALLIRPAWATPIYDIQYTADPSGDSPLVGQTVTTQGVVTAIFHNSFFIEDPAGGAWNGLFVYDPVNTPAIGDHVSLTGTVAEYYGLTELHLITAYSILSSGNPIPAPEVLPTGDVSQERWESVLVQVLDVLVTDEDLGFGEWAVNDGSGVVVIDDKGDYSYVPTNGDVLAAITGPLDYTFGSFKIQPRGNADLGNGSIPEPTALALMGLGLAGVGFARKKILA